MMTGHAAPGDIAQALAAGVVRCFRKPLAFEGLCVRRWWNWMAARMKGA